MTEAPARDEDLEDRFRHGECYAMAMVLAEALGWGIEALVVDVPGGIHIVHAWASVEGGVGLDAGGEVDRNGLHEEFLSRTARKWSNARIESFEATEAYLRRMREMTGDFWEEYRDGRLRLSLAEARAVCVDYVIPRWSAATQPQAIPAPR